MGEHTDVLLSLRSEVLQIATAARALRHDPPETVTTLLEGVDRIAERADGCCRLIDEHLAPAGPAQASAPRATALVAVLTDAIREVEHRGLCPPATVRTTFDDGPLVRASQETVRHILTSLLGDACRHAQPATAVQVRVYARGDEAYVDVVHEGARGDAARLDVLWPETEEDGVDDDAFGPGVTLTLRLVRALVDAHGGHLTMARYGARVTVTVCLPTPPGAPASRVIDLRDRSDLHRHRAPPRPEDQPRR